ALHIASNDSDENPFDIALTGTGTTAAVPEIAVEQPAGTDLVDGVGSRNFGSVLVGTNTSLTFTIRNVGSANLTGLGITIDGADAAQFTVTANPTAPVAPGGSTTFTVRFTPTSAGVKNAALHIASNDSDENPFDIALTGTGTTATAPEIAVELPNGTNLVSNVSNADFGSAVVGTNTSLTFTIRNLGGANLTGLGITINGVDAAQFTVTANPTAPVAPNGSTTFTVRFAPVSAGFKTAGLLIANNDSDENPFYFTLTGTGFDGGSGGTTNVVVLSASPITLNPQTGLFEQTVRVTNSTLSSVSGLRLRILNLPSDVQVYNASGSTNGTPFVQYDLPLAGGAAVDLLIEYYRANRQAIPQPGFVVEVAVPVTVTETGPLLEIDRSVQLASGRFLIEFTATPGARYAVQYSSDTQNWKTANPIITAPANRVQWYDDGPPKTESKPGSVGSRFYRVMQLP
ncbi:MAG: choice-of-anchor D domain-containing protein, partial [Verrucomicrobia bacterium]|nr:choice-of-anchor D domain-containing protein [Verrucomicrobiota bacterium]